MIFSITADVFDGDRDFEKVPDLPNLLCRKPGRFKRVWHREQIMGISSIHAAPAEVVGEPWSVRTLHQLLQPPEVLAVWLLSRSEIHGNAVLYDFVLLKDLIQDVQRPSAIDHEILRDDLKPVDNGFARENMVVVGSRQADCYTVICKPIKAISRHSCSFLSRRIEGQETSPNPRIGSLLSLDYSAGGLEPSVAQPPLPLQEFLPLQPLSPALQPPLPLQEFWPLQACFSLTFLSSFLSWSWPSALKEVFSEGSRVEALVAGAVPANKPANAAPASRALVVLVILLVSLSIRVKGRTRSRLSVSLADRQSCRWV